MKIYDRGITLNGNTEDVYKMLISYRSGDILLPQVKFVEPLRLEAEHFLDCIRTGKEPATGITHARTVVSILERADAIHARVDPRRDGSLAAMLDFSPDGT